MKYSDKRKNLYRKYVFFQQYRNVKYFCDSKDHKSTQTFESNSEINVTDLNNSITLQPTLQKSNKRGYLNILNTAFGFTQKYYSNTPQITFHRLPAQDAARIGQKFQPIRDAFVYVCFNSQYTYGNLLLLPHL